MDRQAGLQPELMVQRICGMRYILLKQLELINSNENYYWKIGLSNKLIKRLSIDLVEKQKINE